MIQGSGEVLGGGAISEFFTWYWVAEHNSPVSDFGALSRFGWFGSGFQVSGMCPLGFALAYVAVFFTSYLESDGDPVLLGFFESRLCSTQLSCKTVATTA